MTISKSVGVNGVNHTPDIKIVCDLLNKCRHLLYTKNYNDLSLAGNYRREIGDRVKLFQRRVVTELDKSDGRVDPNGITIKKLLDNAHNVPINKIGPMLFPFKNDPEISYKTGALGFRANRGGGSRKHAACDMVFPPGTEIRSVADGKVVQSSYPFYSNTYALEVDHAGFLVRYGEIMKDSVPANLDKAGAKIKAGQIIATVGELESGSSMLHFEMYSGTQTGSLTGKGPFKRRSDLLNCTDFLDLAKRN